MAVSNQREGVSEAIPTTHRAAVVQWLREPLTMEQVPRRTVNESMADVEAGRVAARIVFEP